MATSSDESASLTKNDCTCSPGYTCSPCRLLTEAETAFYNHAPHAPAARAPSSGVEVA